MVAPLTAVLASASSPDSSCALREPLAVQLLLGLGGNSHCHRHLQAIGTSLRAFLLPSLAFGFGASWH